MGKQQIQEPTKRIDGMKPKKTIRILTLFLLLVYTMARPNTGKMDPRLGMISLFPETISSQKRGGLFKQNAEWLVEAFVTLADKPTEIIKAGAKVRYINGNTAIAVFPVSRLAEISSLPSVVYMESTVLSHPLTDKSLPDIGVTRVQEQLGYTGRGVLIGVIDSGIDCFHPAFQKQDGTTRIKAILDLSIPGNIYGGTVFSEDDINQALSSGVFLHKDKSGHGTHVAGILAGYSFAESDYKQYKGVATEAELVVVKALRDDAVDEFWTTDEVIALAFIDSVAKALGKPYVANLSIGGQAGSHDGFSPVERFIDNLTGLGVSGKVVVAAAGNEGDEKIHAQANITNSKTSAEITFQVDPYSEQAGNGNDNITFDAWYDGDRKVNVTLVSPSGRSLGPVLQGYVLQEDTQDGAVYIWNGFYESGDQYVQGRNPFNRDREMYIEISDENGAAPKNGLWTLRFSGDQSQVDVWQVDASLPVSFIEGNVDFCKTTIPGTAKNVITVGSYVTKVEWQDMDLHSLTLAENLTVGEISSFSNPGPTRDGRTKPDLCAPGQIIASAKSSQATVSSAASIFYSNNSEFPNAFVLPGGLYGLANGTSFAAPHVAGVVALLLEKNPETTALQIRSMLTSSARTDRITAGTANQWGAGKINAYAAFQLEPGEEPPLDYEIVRAYPNPFSGGTRIEYNLPLSEKRDISEIKIYNSLGQEVRVLLSSYQAAGSHFIYWDGRDNSGQSLSSGIYFVYFKSGEFKKTQKVFFISHIK
jgi:minor extracellular serine protease Vpr